MALRVLVSPFGNAQAIIYAYRELGILGIPATTASDLLNSSHIVIPGVGNFGALVRYLRKNGFEKSLKFSASNGAKILGVCVGMQALFNSSEESLDEIGLGLLDSHCIRLDSNLAKVPHVGWSDVTKIKEHQLTTGLGEIFPAYYSHSFHIPIIPKLTISSTKDGFSMSAIVVKGNVAGVQFHPEKSQTNGLKLLDNFYRWDS